MLRQWVRVVRAASGAAVASDVIKHLAMLGRGFGGVLLSFAAAVSRQRLGSAGGATCTPRSPFSLIIKALEVTSPSPTGSAFNSWLFWLRASPSKKSSKE